MYLPARPCEARLTPSLPSPSPPSPRLVHIYFCACIPPLSSVRRPGYLRTKQVSQGARYGIPSAHCISPAPADRSALLAVQSLPQNTDEPRGLALAAAPLQVAPHRPTSRRRQSSACIPTQLNYPSEPVEPIFSLRSILGSALFWRAREIEPRGSDQSSCAVQCSLCCVVCCCCSCYRCRFRFRFHASTAASCLTRLLASFHPIEPALLLHQQQRSLLHTRSRLSTRPGVILLPGQVPCTPDCHLSGAVYESQPDPVCVCHQLLNQH